MTRSIHWTLDAEEDFLKIDKYLAVNWSPKIALKFQDIFYSKLAYIDMFPQSGVLVDSRENVRKISITKHNKLYFSITQSEIILFAIFDTRQNPKKNKFE